MKLLPLLPYIEVATIPGIVNIIAAWQELDKQCKYLPFFKPYKSFGFWIWLVLQFLSPAFLFWFVADLESKPVVNVNLIFESFALGIGFVAILNASTEIGTLSFKLKPVYDFFIGIAFNVIANVQTGRTASFWNDIEKELSKSNINLNEGLSYLENYFMCDPALARKPQERKSKIDQLRAIHNKTSKTEKAKAVKSLIMMNVRRKDLHETLNKFNCEKKLLKDYLD